MNWFCLLSTVDKYHNMRATILILFAHLSWATSLQQEKIETVVQWKRIEFDYPSEQHRQADIDAKIYNPDVPMPIDADVYYRNPNERMIFVTIPKFSPGVPATFGLVTDRMGRGDPLIQPFPSWDWHRDTSLCKKHRLVSVFRVQIDRCGLLWILDSGNEGAGVICPPQILVFDLKQWPKEKRPYYWYEFPKEVYKNNSILLTVMMEVHGSECKNAAFAYVADARTDEIVVTDLNKEYSWRIKHRSMAPEPDFTNFEIAGDRFQLDDGILGMALSPEKNDFDENRYLYYSPMAGSFESRISTYDMKHVPKIYTYSSPRRSQSAAMVINKDGIAFFGLLSNITINCWNINSNNYGNYINTVYSNRNTMQFPSGIKIAMNFNCEEELWILTSRFQVSATTGYNFNEVNFRISMGNVNNLLEGSKCNYY